MTDTSANGASDGTGGVVLYWRPGCPFCSTLRRRMQKRGIPFESINIWDDPAGAARVRGVAGGDETVPTVFIGERGLVNPGITQLEALIREAAPHLLAGHSPRRRWWGGRRHQPRKTSGPWRFHTNRPEAR